MLSAVFLDVVKKQGQFVPEEEYWARFVCEDVLKQGREQVLPMLLDLRKLHVSNLGSVELLKKLPHRQASLVFLGQYRLDISINAVYEFPW